MSKLLKSKFLLGVVFVAVMFVGAVALSATPAAAADCSITSTLRVGSKGVQVQCLQTALGITADGSFGPKTKAAVVAFQANAGLVADGIFGAKSRAVWMSNNGVGSSFAPAGCTNASGFSPVTGGACYAVASNSSLPVGCTSTSGFSPVTGASCATGVVNNQTGPVTATLASTNPSAGTLVSGQATADLAHFVFGGVGTVNTITLQRTGITSNTALSSVYLYNGATRLTDSASVSTNGTITFNNVNLAVNGSVTVSVKADIETGLTGGTVGVTLVGYTAAGNTASVVSVAGNVMNITAGGAGILGAINFPTVSATTPAVNAGVTQYVLWTDATTVSTHSMLLKSAAFHFVGSAPTDSLANIGLFLDGTKIATSTGVNSLGYLVFDLSAAPVTLSTGSHTVEVRADIVKGSYRSIQLTLQNAGDFMVMDSQLGVNVAATYNSTTFSPISGPAISVNQGTLSIQIDPTFTAMTNVTGGATNALIGKYKVTAYGEDQKVQTINLTPTWTGSPATAPATNSLNNVALYYNGSQVGSSKNLDNTPTALSFSLGSSLVAIAGTTGTLEVRADMQNHLNANYTAGTITVASATMPAGSVQGMSSLQTNVGAVAIPTTTGLAVSTGLLSIAANPAYTTQTVSPNTTGVKIASFVLQNQTSSESVRVTNLGINIALTTVGSTNYSNLKTSETSGSGANPINLSTAAAAATSLNNFSVDFTIAPGVTKVIDVYADVGSDVGSLVVDLLTTARGVNSNVSAAPSTQSGQTINIAAGTFANSGVVVSSATAPQYVAAANGATNATKATYNFKSTNGTATVSELKFNVTTSTGASVSTVTVNGVSAPVVSGVAYLTGLTIAVPNGGAGINVDAFMSYGPVGTNGNTSGAESYVEMTYIKATIGGTTVTTTGGQGTLANNTLLTTQNAGNAPAAVGSTASLTFVSTAKMQPGMMIVIDNATDSVGVVQSVTNATTAVVQTVFLGTADNAGTSVRFYSVPQNAVYGSTVNNCSMTLSVAGTTVAVGGTSGTDCMSIVGSKPTLGVVDASTLLINGLVKVGSVTVAADAKGDVAINALPLTFNSTGNVSIGTGTDNLVVKNAADQSTVNTTNNTLAVAAAGTDDTTVTFTGGYTVTAGQTVTFDVYATAATVTGGPAANALSMKLGAAALLLWTDVAGSATGTETGALLYNYPTNSSVIND